MDTNKYPKTIWNPHERKRRLLECDYENDPGSKNSRTYKVHGEIASPFITKGGLTFHDGSTNMVDEARNERGKSL